MYGGNIDWFVDGKTRQNWVGEEELENPWGASINYIESKKKFIFFINLVIFISKMGWKVPENPYWENFQKAPTPNPTQLPLIIFHFLNPKPNISKP